MCTSVCVCVCVCVFIILCVILCVLSVLSYGLHLECGVSFFCAFCRVFLVCGAVFVVCPRMVCVYILSLSGGMDLKRILFV